MYYKNEHKKRMVWRNTRASASHVEWVKTKQNLSPDATVKVKQFIFVPEQ